MRMILVLGVLLASSGLAQTCVQQPPPELDRISEWSCKAMSFEQAWDLLTANQIAPVRYAKITGMGEKANYASKKRKLIRGLQIAGFAAGLAGAILANNAALTDLQLAALVAGPKVVEAGVVFFSGAPELFSETPNEAGFTTIYSLYSDRLIAGPIAVAPRSGFYAPATSASSIPVFKAATWFALYRETLPDTERLRQAEIAWSREWAIHEAQMNEAELEIILAGVR